MKKSGYGRADSGIYMLVGGAGVPNYGDELIVSKWVDWIRRGPRFEHLKLVVELNHMRVSDGLGLSGMQGVFPSGDVSLARYLLGSTSFDKAFDAGRHFFTDRHKDPRLERLAERLSRAAVFHLHGGGYLNDLWPSHAFSLGLGCAVKEQFDCVVLGTGLGLGPFALSGAGQRLREAASMFDVFEVRDGSSFELCGPEGVSGLDDVFLGPVSSDLIGGDVLHVSLIGATSPDDVARMLPLSFVNKFDRCFFWMCTPNDAQSFAAVGGLHRHFAPLTPRDLLGPIPCGRSNFMVTERFHPHLVGARLGFGGTFFSSNEYYDAKHGSVIELGSGFVSSSGFGQVEKAYEETTPSSAMVDADAGRIAEKDALVRSAF